MGRRAVRLATLFDEDQHLGEGKHAHDGDQEVDAVIEVHVAEREARHACLTVNSHKGQRQTDGCGEGCFGLIGAGDAAQRGKCQGEHGEIFGGAEEQGQVNQLGRKKHKTPGGEEGAHER